MSQQEKGQYYRALVAAGMTFPKHYREYTTAELKAAYDRLAEGGEAPPLEETPPPKAQRSRVPAAPVRAKDPNEMAGQRQNQLGDMEPLRTDPETGFVWYQEEVRKPDYAKPRGRRVLKYDDPGVKTVQMRSGDYTESFEVAGDRAIPSEVKITLPSYQVGIYVDPRFPRFRVHTYGGAQGFNLFDVQDFYGGAELVPAECKRIYVENDLCYDVRSVVRAISEEYRRLQLAGKV